MDITPHILLVDDEINFSEITCEYLEAKGCKIILKHAADIALVAFKNEHFDLCILDVKMPFKNGFELAEEIRELDEFVPIIFLTGEVKKSSRLKGLNFGADDYITKPFSMEELYLRIKNTLRRTLHQNKKSNKKQRYQIGQFSFEVTSRELFFRQEIQKLTTIEAQLLQMFCDNQNGLVERNLALKRIWGDDNFVRGRSLNVYVSKLRSYLKQDERIQLLNVHGVGYKMVVTP